MAQINGQFVLKIFQDGQANNVEKGGLIILIQMSKKVHIIVYI